MTRGRSFVLAIGQVPPPITGFALITGQMIERIARHSDVKVVNVSPPAAGGSLWKHLHKAKQVLKGCWCVLRNRHPQKILYIGCEGDWGLLYTILVVAIASLRSYRILLHHHSFSYIDRRFRLMQLILWIGRAHTEHIFLCETMQSRFSDRYGKLAAARIISNAAFVPPSSNKIARSSSGPLRIGLLSNLTREKGLHTFLELIAQARSCHPEIVGVLAGPMAANEDIARVEIAKKELGTSLEYLGPLFGKAKEDFYNDIDLFVFPTEYANEAQPTVLFEAQAAGNRIVSFNRGCISDQLREHGIAPHSIISL
ncbi:glycosyltransferase involved in cell wall biosynthesis [Bradyrhizobium ottawaense]